MGGGETPFDNGLSERIVGESFGGNTMTFDKSLLPSAVFGGLIAVGLIGAGIFVGQGVINARVGDRQVTVRGVSERNVIGDLAVLSLRFTAAGEELPEVQARIDGDLALVRGFLKAQGYPDDIVALGRLEVTDTKSREYVSSEAVPHYILAQTVVVRTNDVNRVAATGRALNDLVRQGVVLDFTPPTYVFTKLNEVR
jgi:hypothetical protein